MPQTVEAHAVVLRPTIAIGYKENRPWRQKWLDLLSTLEQLEAAYLTDDGQGNEDVRRVVENFFATCWELADWLGRTSRPPAFTSPP